MRIGNKFSEHTVKNEEFARNAYWFMCYLACRMNYTMKGWQRTNSKEIRMVIIFVDHEAIIVEMGDDLQRSMYQLVKTCQVYVMTSKKKTP